MPKSKLVAFDESVRMMPQYEKGRRAYDNGLDCNCPYVRGDKRTSWCTGWYDARTEDRLGDILATYNLSWP